MRTNLLPEGSMRPSEFPEVQSYPNLKRLLNIHIDMLFADMSRIMSQGCNFSAAALLMNIISGASVCFFDVSRDNPAAVFDSGRRGERFERLLGSYYPWTQNEAMAKQECILVLYNEIRNPLTHGLALDKPALSPRRIEIANVAGLSEAQVSELEGTYNRPPWVLPTFVRDVDPKEPSKIALFVPALYWGVHRMLRDLFKDQTQARGGEALAEFLLNP